ncbi:DUF2829 domain-containing protein [bacterium]|nr:DUF2829 domain-containing protein [bacterium]
MIREALARLRAGRAVRRRAWRFRRQLRYFPPVGAMGARFILTTADQGLHGWAPNYDDLTAEDWCEVPVAPGSDPVPRAGDSQRRGPLH